MTARRRRFKVRGQRLWDAHHDGLDQKGLVMLEEACRIADRLDELDRILTGDRKLWLYLVDGRDGSIEVRVDGALVEARQQANVLRQILAGLPARAAGDDDGDGWVEDVGG